MYFLGAGPPAAAVSVLIVDVEATYGVTVTVGTYGEVEDVVLIVVGA